MLKLTESKIGHFCRPVCFVANKRGRDFRTNSAVLRKIREEPLEKKIPKFVNCRRCPTFKYLDRQTSPNGRKVMICTFLVSDTAIPSSPIRSQTYDLPITNSDARPLSYTKLVEARPIKLLVGLSDNILNVDELYM